MGSQEPEARSQNVQTHRVRPLSCGYAILASGFWLLASLSPSPTHAQPEQLPTEIPAVRFHSGQAVVPYFEGWIRNPDGTFDLVFGYFNRNWQQELAILPGPQNNVEPFGPDAGQPTYFLPRRQRWVFRLRVPADFGKKEVTWTITANGQTEKAYGSLLPAQEITDRVIRSGGFDPGHNDPNEPPSVTISTAPMVSTATPVTFTLSVRDDGLPQSRTLRAPRAPTTGFGAQIDRSRSAAPSGPTVRWIQYRGPGKVTFDQTGPIRVVDGRVVTTARFEVPGTYQLRAVANDGALSTTADVVITVK